MKIRGSSLKCCVWSMIVHRSLFQLDVYPRKFVHPSTRGGARGTCPPRGGPGGPISPGWGVWGPAVAGGGSGAAPLKLKTDVKLPCKSIVISSQSGPFIRRMI